MLLLLVLLLLLLLLLLLSSSSLLLALLLLLLALLLLFRPQDLGNRLQLHVAGSLVDGPYLAIPIEFLRREILGETDSSEPLDGFAGGLFRHLAAIELGHAGLFRNAVVVVVVVVVVVSAVVVVIIAVLLL